MGSGRRAGAVVDQDAPSERAGCSLDARVSWPIVMEPLLPVYLVTGSDRPKVRRALERLRARFVEGSVEFLSAEKQPDREAVTGADAIAACNALGLFGGDDAGRLVVVE